MPDEAKDSSDDAAALDAPSSSAMPAATAAPAQSSPVHHAGHSALPRPKFLEKLKQRNVGRVALLYIGFAYLILEVFELFYHLLEMPAWAGRLFVLVVVLGFPVALLIAWAYEITPEGLRPVAAGVASQAARAQIGRRLDRAVIIILAAALSYFVFDKFWLSRHATREAAATPLAPASTSIAAAAIPEKSVAVLPFIDLSEKKDQEYFSDGLSEEMIDILTKDPELRVPARTSSFFFKGKQATIGEIASALRVAHVLEGSVRKSGEKLRITVQLIRAADGYHLWSETFNRNAGDIFEIQDQISNAVVRALKASLAPVGPGSVGTSNADAYDLLLLAISKYASARTKNDYESIVAQLHDAIRLDPAFSRAWAMLSVTLSAMAGYGMTESTSGFAEAKNAAQKAIELDPKDAFGHRAMAKILMLHDWDWQRTDSEIQQALAIDPDSPSSLLLASDLAAYRGDLAGALQYVRRAIARDPLNSYALDTLGQILESAGEFEDAQAALQRAQQLNPSYTNAHWNLGIALLLGNKKLDALAEFEREANEEDRIPGRALAYFGLGRAADAEAAVRKAESLAPTIGSYAVARIYAYRNEPDQAFAWLERAYQSRETDCGSVKTDPLLSKFRNDPRFSKFLRQMNLPDQSDSATRQGTG